MSNPLQIAEMVQTIKEQCARLNTKRFFYSIYAIDTRFGDKFSCVIPDSSNKEKESTVCNEFNTCLDSLIKNPDVAAVRVVFKNGNRKEISSPEIWLREKTYTSPLPINFSTHNETAHTDPLPRQQAEQPQIAPQQTQFTGALQGIDQIVTLLGFDVHQGLDGAVPINPLGTLLAVRDQRITEKFENERRTERYESIIEERALLKAKVEELERKNTNSEAEKIALREKVDELEDVVEELEQEMEKLNPSQSFAGVSMQALGTKILLGAAKKLSKPIAALSGIEETVILDAINSQDESDDEPQQLGQAQAPETPRTQHIKALGQFVESLSEEQFVEFWKLINLMSQNRTIITDLHHWAMGDKTNNIVQDDE